MSPRFKLLRLQLIILCPQRDVKSTTINIDLIIVTIMKFSAIYHSEICIMLFIVFIIIFENNIILYMRV